MVLVNRRRQDDILKHCLGNPNLVSDSFSYDAEKRCKINLAMFSWVNVSKWNAHNWRKRITTCLLMRRLTFVSFIFYFLYNGRGSHLYSKCLLGKKLKSVWLFDIQLNPALTDFRGLTNFDYTTLEISLSHHIKPHISFTNKKIYKKSVRFWNVFEFSSSWRQPRYCASNCLEMRAEWS